MTKQSEKSESGAIVTAAAIGAAVGGVLVMLSDKKKREKAQALYTDLKKATEKKLSALQEKIEKHKMETKSSIKKTAKKAEKAKKVLKEEA